MRPVSVAADTFTAMHVYDSGDRASGWVLRGRTWRPCIIRARWDDGRVNVQVTVDGEQFLENVAAESVVLDE